jgi:hypothetical protein
MILALLWLTVSTPFVYAQQQAKKETAQKQVQQSQADEEESGNPLSNSNEEKSESGVNTLSEYLHDALSLEHHFVILTNFYKCRPSSIYFEYHPELISPPPEFRA